MKCLNDLMSPLRRTTPLPSPLMPQPSAYSFRRILCPVLLAALFLLTGCATAARSAQSHARKYQSVQQYTLPNGLTLSVQQDQSIPLVTMDMWVRVGSGDETPEVAGISHFLEHMLFKGTERLPVGQYDRNVEEAGGYLNAATSMDYTHYYVTVPSEHFARILTDFADVMTNSSIDPQEVESERNVILEEISRKLDSPFGYLFDETMPRLFESGPYTHTVIGTRETVSAITRDQLHDHYRRFYVPENMFLSIVGDVEPSEVRDQVEAAFRAQTGKLRPYRDEAPAARFARAEDRFLPNSWKEAYFILAFPGPKGNSLQGMAVSEYAETLLAGGRASRLVNSLQEKQGLVSSISAWFPTNRHEAPLMIYGTCEPGKIEDVRAAIITELIKLKEEGTRDTEMRRVRRQVLNNHLYSLETNAGRASTLGYSQTMLGNPSLLTGFAEALRGVSEKELMAYLRKHLREDQASFHVTTNAAALATRP